MVFSEFTNKVKYSNRIPSHLQSKVINGFTECLIMNGYLILYFHNDMHIKKWVFQLFENLKINFTQYILFLTFYILNNWILGKNQGRGKLLMGGTH